MNPACHLPIWSGLCFHWSLLALPPRRASFRFHLGCCPGGSQGNTGELHGYKLNFRIKINRSIVTWRLRNTCKKITTQRKQVTFLKKKKKHLKGSLQKKCYIQGCVFDFQATRLKEKWCWHDFVVQGYFHSVCKSHLITALKFHQKVPFDVFYLSKLTSKGFRSAKSFSTGEND